MSTEIVVATIGTSGAILTALLGLLNKENQTLKRLEKLVAIRKDITQEKARELVDDSIYQQSLRLHTATVREARYQRSPLLSIIVCLMLPLGAILLFLGFSRITTASDESFDMALFGIGIATVLAGAGLFAGGLVLWESSVEKRNLLKDDLPVMPTRFKDAIDDPRKKENKPRPTSPNEPRTQKSTSTRSARTRQGRY